MCEDDGHVVGFASTGPSRDEDELGELYAIYVEPDAWSTGAGRALMIAAESSARARVRRRAAVGARGQPAGSQLLRARRLGARRRAKAEERFGVRAAEVRYRKDFDHATSARRLRQMVGWILIVIGYVLLIGGFRLLGGVTSAMDALRSWGSSTAGRQPSVSSS